MIMDNSDTFPHIIHLKISYKAYALFLNFRMATPVLVSDRQYTEDVQRHPVLYNPKEHRCKDSFKVEAKWQSVTAHMGCTGDNFSLNLFKKQKKLSQVNW